MKRLFLIGCLAFTCVFGGIDNSARADNDIWMKLVGPGLGDMYPNLFACAKSSSALAFWPWYQ